MLDDVRSRLIDAARVELAAQGRVSVRVSRIARRARVSTGAIYSNFGSRDEMLAEASAARLHELSTTPMSFSGVASLIFGDGPPDFHALYEALGAVCSPAGEIGRLDTLDAVIAGNHSDVARDITFPVMRGMLGYVAALVEQSQRAGYTMRDIHPLAIATNLVAAAMGSAGVESALRDTKDSAPSEAARQALFVAMTAFFVERPPAPWGAGVAHYELPAASRPILDAELSDSGLALVESAKRALWESGNIEFNVARVAADAGLTTGALYSQFRSREGMIAAAYESRLSATLSAPEGPVTVAAALFTPTSENPDHIIDLIVSLDSPASHQQRASVVEALVESGHNVELRSTLRGTTAYLVSEIANVVRQAQSAGAVRDDVDPVAVSAIWVGSSVGLTAFRSLDPGVPEPEFVCEVMTGLLVVLNAAHRKTWTQKVVPGQLGPFAALATESAVNDTGRLVVAPTV